MSTRRIVVGVDGSPGSRAALLWAADEAMAREAEIEAVMAYDFGLAWIDVGSDAQARFIESATKKAQESLHQVLAEVLPEPRPVAVHPVVVEGAPAAVLVEMSRNAELLVVGTRGRGGFTGLLLGSVSQRCVERSPCPVVVVPIPA
ncbi:MAG TPA: universal stress protein [Acidimicrobiia bacterium]|nr:universal stress protein [Acidimicrobiia bacterium]